jgi:predicted lipoprotein with Yx(FWY)xxD motif
MATRLLMVSALILLSAAAAQAGSVMQGSTPKGHVLTNEKGMTLYTFDKDGMGQSACVDACAQNWPPLLADAGAKVLGEYSLIKRADGALQWAYRGKPLYLWAKDMKPGDTTGDGFRDIWHVARP